MIRFSATEAETLELLRFLERRARRVLCVPDDGRTSGLLWLPLRAQHLADLKPRRTALRLQRLLKSTGDACLWGVRLASDASHDYAVARDPKTGTYHVDPEASRLILVALSPVADDAERRRDGIMELRDWVLDDAPEEPDADTDAPTPKPKGVVLLPQTTVARDLVERCARRLRRRGTLIGNQWHVPAHLPPGDDE